MMIDVGHEDVVIESNKSVEGLYQIKEIAKEVANKTEYKLNVYDCTEFSRDLIKELNNLEIESYCVYGNYYELTDHGNYVTKKTSKHTWVAVDYQNKIFYIEATKGEIIDHDNFDTNYKILSKGKCL